MAETPIKNTVSPVIVRITHTTRGHVTTHDGNSPPSGTVGGEIPAVDVSVVLVENGPGGDLAHLVVLDPPP